MCGLVAWSSRQVVTGDPDAVDERPPEESDIATPAEVVTTDSEYPGSIVEALERACETH